MDRRQFIQTSAIAAGASVFSNVYSQNASLKQKIRVGYVGTGTQGIRTLFEFLSHDDILVVAVCDANRDSQDYIEWYKDELRTKIRTFLKDDSWGEDNQGCRAGRMVGKEIVETCYKRINPQPDYPGCHVYEDFRDMLANEPDLDAVCVMTPEHLHATISIAAMRAGKHVINHKPMGNVLSEVRLAAQVARETGVATHMFCAASMHTTPLLCEWIWNGAIGQVRQVHNWSKRPFWPQGMDLPKEGQPIPDGFNWDLWQGPVMERSFNHAFTHSLFRGWYDYGTGALGDMGHYSFYQLWQILKLGAPLSVEASRSQYYEIVDCYWELKDNKVSYPRASAIKWEFPARDDMDPVELYWYDGGLQPPIPAELESDKRKMPEEGLLFVGDKGKILATFNGGSPRIIPESKMKAYTLPPKTLPRPKDELDQWVNAIRTGEKSGADYSVIKNINETICLGTIALRVPEKMYWDEKQMKISNNEDANQYIYRDYRKGWELDVDSIKKG